jgi:TolA-binding protein
LAELERLQGRLAVLESVLQLATSSGAQSGKGEDEVSALEAAAREAEAVRARILELKRRQAAGELTPEEEEELRRLEARLVQLEKVIESGMDAAAREAEEIRARILELKRKQAAGELTPEELAELERLQGRLAVLESVLAAGPAAAFGACGVDANGTPIDKNGLPGTPSQHASAGNPCLGS